jgi:hypothetical protein
MTPLSNNPCHRRRNRLRTNRCGMNRGIVTVKRLFVLILILFASPASATSYFVSVSGKDTNTGRSTTAAWATIQHASITMRAGDNVTVLAGKYPERVYVTRSGSSTAPITFAADPTAIVQVQGFEIQGANYIQVVGFDITGTSRTSGDTEHMFGILWQGSFGLIQNNYIHDLCAEGVMMGWTGNPTDPTVANNQILNNRIERVEMAGIEVDGKNNSVTGNSIEATLQFPVGCPARNGADADGIRAFGTGHLINHNHIYGIQFGTATNPVPHADCFQSWGPLTTTTFDANNCSFPSIGGSATSAEGNEAGNFDNSSGTVQHVWMINNVFKTMRQGPSVTNYGGSSLLDFQFINNTMDNVAQQGLITKGLASALIENNIFYNVGTGFGGGDSFLADDGTSTYTLAANDFWVTNGSPGTWPQNYQHLQANPQFIDEPDGVYGLLAASSLIGQGVTVNSVTHDFDGSSRTAAGGYDIGAYEGCALGGC